MRVGVRLKHYRLVSKLGAGGMGTVYLAEVIRGRKGLATGAEVAVKILHAHLADDPDVLARFQREAGLGLRIRHPRVVSVLDVGHERQGGVDIHYLVMEVLRGRTLREVMDAEGPFSDARVVHYGRQVAEGLAEIHRVGAVHRDIKPGNLFLHAAEGPVEDHEVKIADLGLSRLLDAHTEISLPGTILGSVAYSAPEQLQGHAVTPAADLYALGVTLYEMASAVNPFREGDLKACIQAHLTRTPRPLSELAPRASWFLERVVAMLMAKDPANRIAPAARLARTLEGRERSEFWRDQVQGEGPNVRLSEPRRRLRVRRASRIHGSADELGHIVDVVRTATVGRVGGVGLVSGETGIGRTRFLDGVLVRLEDEGWDARVVVSRFLNQATPVPFFAWNSVILQALGIDRDPREERRARLVEGLRAHLPERSVFAESFASLIDDKDPAEALRRLPEDAIPAIYAECLRTLSVRRPLVIVIEELQWADRGSLRVLRALVPAVTSFPLAILLTERDADESVTSHLRWLTTRRETVAIVLPRIDRKAVRGILRDLAVPESTEKLLAARLHSTSGGNPGFLFGLIEELERQGHLRDGRHGELKSLPLPRNLVDLLRRRLDELDPDARAFLEFASVFGVRFKLEPVVEGLGLDLVSASEIVARLRGRYQMIRPADGAYRLDPGGLRELVYLGIPARRRRAHNAAVGRIIAREVSDPHVASRHAYEAAIHLSLAEEHASAARYLVGAARYLAERSLHERAMRLANRGKEHAQQAPELSPSDRVAVHVTLAEELGHLGQRDQQGTELRSAALAAVESGDRRKIAEVEVMLARHAGGTGRVFAALGHVERAQSVAREADAMDLVAAALRVESQVMWILGHVNDEDRLDEACRLAEEAGDTAGLAYGQLQLARMRLSNDRPAAALRILKEALKLFESLHDERGRGRAFFQIARVYREFGDLGRARKAVVLATAIAEANQDRGLHAQCLYVQGDLALRSRDYEEAQRLLELARRELAEVGDATFLVYSLVTLSLLYTATRYVGRAPERAVEFAQRAAEVARGLMVPRMEAITYASLASAYLAHGRRRFALAVSQKGVKFVEEEEGAGRKRASEILFIHYRCLKALGRVEEAKGFLRRAVDLVEERANEIEEPSARRSFMKNDLFNAAVRKEAKEVLRGK